MPSIVYVLTNPAMPGLVKIGQTAQEDANTRIAALYATGVPFPFKLEFACHVENPVEVERALHTAFAPYRVNARREFFSIEPGQAIAVLRLLHSEDATGAVAAEPAGPEPAEVAEGVAAGEQYRRARRPNLNFGEMGIAIGSILTATATDATVAVCGPRRVRFGEEEMSLTAATRKLLDLDYSVAPAPYWSFKGRPLKDIYEETYPIDD